ncbi:MAG: patatin-like phospholipase family protein [Luteolibacter sp.]
MSEQSSADPGIALALGSSFLGVYTHGGFLCGMNAAGIYPGHIAGASAGAIAGGFYAAGLRENALENAVLSATLKRSFADWGMFIRSAPMLFSGRLTGMMHGRKTIKYLTQSLPVQNIEDTPGVKLSIAVANLEKLESTFLTSGSLAQSIVASCSVPILFTGQNISGTTYYDGGITHELPVEPFLTTPEIHTIIVHRIANIEKNKNHLTVSDAFGNIHNMLNNALFDFRKKEAERHGKKVIVMETAHPHPGLFQTKAAKKRFFEAGKQTALNLDRTKNTS